MAAYPDVTVPGTYLSPPNSVGTTKNLLDAFDRIDNRQNERRKSALSALGQNKVLRQDALKRDILDKANDPKERFYNQFNTRVEDEMNNLFIQDSQGNYIPKTSTDPKEQALLSQRQKQWNSGEYFENNPKFKTAMSNMEKGYDILDPKAYSQDIYNTMIQRGFTPEQAEDTRKKEIARFENKMTAEQKDLMKAELEDIAKQRKLEAEALDKVHSFERGNTSSSTTNKSGMNKFLNSKDFYDALQLDKGNDWSMFGSGRGGEPVYRFYSNMIANGLTPAEAYSYIANKSHEEFMGEDNEVNEDLLNIGKAKIFANNYRSNRGYNPTTGSSGKVYDKKGIRNPVLYQKSMNKLMDEYDKRRQAVLNRYNKPGGKQILNDFFERNDKVSIDSNDKPNQKPKTKEILPSSKNKKTVSDFVESIDKNKILESIKNTAGAKSLLENIDKKQQEKIDPLDRKAKTKIADTSIPVIQRELEEIVKDDDVYNSFSNTLQKGINEYFPFINSDINDRKVTDKTKMKTYQKLKDIGVTDVAGIKALRDKLPDGPAKDAVNQVYIDAASQKSKKYRDEQASKQRGDVGVLVGQTLADVLTKGAGIKYGSKVLDTKRKIEKVNDLRKVNNARRKVRNSAKRINDFYNSKVKKSNDNVGSVFKRKKPRTLDDIRKAPRQKRLDAIDFLRKNKNSFKSADSMTDFLIKNGFTKKEAVNAINQVITKKPQGILFK